MKIRQLPCRGQWGGKWVKYLHGFVKEKTKPKHKKLKPFKHSHHGRHLLFR